MALTRLLRGAWAKDLRFHYIVLQQAPRFHAELGQMQICWQCPDAVVRRDALVPVCMAGRLRPLDGSCPSAPESVVDAALAHLDPPRG